MSLIALAPLLMALTASPAKSADRCPIFAKGVDLTWQQSDGPDFTVCYAIDKSKRQLFGVYTGHAASYERKGRTKAKKSKVAGISAQWVVGEGPDKSSMYRETLINVHAARGPDYEAHIWITAANNAQLTQALAALSTMRFRY